MICKKNIAKFTILILTLAIAIALAACGTDGNHELTGRWRYESDTNEATEQNIELQFNANRTGYSAVEGMELQPFTWRVQDNVEIYPFEIGILELSYDTVGDISFYYRIEDNRLIIWENQQSTGWSYIRIDD